VHVVCVCMLSFRCAWLRVRVRGCEGAGLCIFLCVCLQMIGCLLVYWLCVCVSVHLLRWWVCVFVGVDACVSKMHVCVCVFMFACLCLCLCMSVCVRACLCARVRALVSVRMVVPVRVTCARLFARACACSRVQFYFRVHAHDVIVCVRECEAHKRHRVQQFGFM